MGTRYKDMYFESALRTYHLWIPFSKEEPSYTLYGHTKISNTDDYGHPIWTILVGPVFGTIYLFIINLIYAKLPVSSRLCFTIAYGSRVIRFFNWKKKIEVQSNFSNFFTSFGSIPPMKYIVPIRIFHAKFKFVDQTFLSPLDLE